eukprot:m.135283 g.135283  ORF g.135283 m.135283 type:complete len:476 (-) comp29787_c0_seq1:30-1457(-)
MNGCSKLMLWFIGVGTTTVFPCVLSYTASYTTLQNELFDVIKFGNRVHPTWEDAKEFCDGKGMRLPIAAHDDAQEALYTVCSKGNTDCGWTGANCSTRKGCVEACTNANGLCFTSDKWNWIDGSSLTEQLAPGIIPASDLKSLKLNRDLCMRWDKQTMLAPTTCDSNINNLRTVCEHTQPSCPPVTELTRTVMDGLCGHNSLCEDDDSCISTYGVHRGPDARGCDESDTVNVRKALANGMFGGSDGNQRDCNSHCLYDLDTPDEIFYQWEPVDKCYTRKAAATSEPCWQAIAYREYAVEKRSYTCLAHHQVADFISQVYDVPVVPDVPDAPVVTSTIAPSTTVADNCITAAPTLTTELMKGMCPELECEGTSCKPSGKEGPQYGPEAVGCKRIDNDRIRKSLANGMFGKVEGSSRDCNAWCLYDFEEPERIQFIWHWPKKACWKKYKTSNMCIKNSEADAWEWAKTRQSNMCDMA